jgi:hypothetical protein
MTMKPAIYSAPSWRANGGHMVIITDTQRDAITSAAKPLQPTERQAFLGDLFETLLMRRSREQVGDGELGRTLRELQHRYFEPPETSGHEPGPRGWGRAGRT